MAEIKGVLLNAQTIFLKNRYSEADLERAKATLDPRLAALLKAKYLDSAWYPYETAVALRHLMRSLPNADELDPAVIGAFIAEHTFTGVYESLLSKYASKLVANMGLLHSLVYRDFNELESRLTGERSCAVSYRRTAMDVKPARAICRSLIGFWSKVLELGTGATVTGAHPSCVCDGQPRCEFTYAW